MAQAGQPTQVVEAQVVEAVDPGQECVAPQRVIRLPTGVSLGTCIRGVHIRLHWSMFMIVVLSLLTSLIRWDAWIIVIFNFLIDGPILFLTVFMHEIGHVLVTLKQGGEVTDVVLWPGGGLTITGPNDGSLWNDFKAAIAGPLMQIPLMIVWAILILICDGATDRERTDSIADAPVVFFWNLAYYSLRLNFLILCANIVIPVYPFDAGRIVGDLLMMAGLSVSTAAKSAASLGLGVGFATLMLAFFSAFGLYSVIDILLAIVIMAMSASLFLKAKNGRLKEDIIFGRPCYHGNNDVGGNTNVELPAANAMV